MHTTINSDDTVTLVVSQDELAILNDALYTRVALATFPRHSADRLTEADHERAVRLEHETFGGLLPSLRRPIVK